MSFPAFNQFLRFLLLLCFIHLISNILFTIGKPNDILRKIISLFTFIWKITEWKNLLGQIADLTYKRKYKNWNKSDFYRQSKHVCRTSKQGFRVVGRTDVFYVPQNIIICKFKSIAIPLTVKSVKFNRLRYFLFLKHFD